MLNVKRLYRGPAHEQGRGPVIAYLTKGRVWVGENHAFGKILLMMMLNSFVYQVLVHAGFKTVTYLLLYPVTLCLYVDGY